MDSLAAVFREVGAPVSIERIALDPPGPTEVLVRIAAVGLCRTDYHVMRGERRVAMQPMVLGHEAAAVVEQVGGAVTGISSGDHVVLTFIPGCGNATGAGAACIICAPRARASRRGRNSTAPTAGVTATARRSAPSA
jgi:Zn-dependent alcohol dehydrogenase